MKRIKDRFTEWIHEQPETEQLKQLKSEKKENIEIKQRR